MSHVLHTFLPLRERTALIRKEGRKIRSRRKASHGETLVVLDRLAILQHLREGVRCIRSPENPDKTTRPIDRRRR